MTHGWMFCIQDKWVESVSQTAKGRLLVDYVGYRLAIMSQDSKLSYQAMEALSEFDAV